MGDLHNLKAMVEHEIDELTPLLIECSDWLADNPELSAEEYQSSARLTAMLEDAGAVVERGITDYPTAFRATLAGSNADRPTIAILAEYDALPDVGHACGHNLIGTSAVGAGMALSRLRHRGELSELSGNVIILGTPAEETTGSKIDFIEQGYFDDVDAAIMMHPGYEDSISAGTLTTFGVEFEFHGKPAHSALDPHNGINALDAVIQTFVNIGSLRQQLRDEARIHGVITNGGGAVNIIPMYAACRFGIRSYDLDYAKELKQRVIACAEGAAIATGAKLEWNHFMRSYLSYLPNSVIGDMTRTNMVAVGHQISDTILGGASSDFGNVSQVVPTAYPLFGICESNIAWHSKGVADATKSARGHEALIAATKTLALTTVDLLGNPDLVEKAKQEHRTATEASRK